MRPGITVYDVMSKKAGEKNIIDVRAITLTSCDKVRKTVVGKDQNGSARIYREADYKNWRVRAPHIVDDPSKGMLIERKTMRRCN